MGSIYKRGNVWWIKYYRNGKNYRESSKSTKKMVAKKLLDRREGEISQGKLPGVYFEKVTFDQLAEDFLRDYRINQKKSLDRAERSVNRLNEFFQGDKVPYITTPRIKEFVTERMKWACRDCKERFHFNGGKGCPKCGGEKLVKGASNATINRELAALKRMLNLGSNQTPPIVDRVPYIPMLKENNVRKGFFEHSDFEALRAALPSYLKGFATFAYKVGWRKSEIMNLTWNQVDLKTGIVRLEAGETKNEEGRTVFLDGELMEIFTMQWKVRKLNGALTPYVFPNREGLGPIRDFKSAWANACKNAKIGHRLFHDFRRTAVRNMVRAGVPERVAMMISGHKTRSVFDRYNIVSERDLQSAAKKQEAYLESVAGTKSGTIHDFAKKQGAADDG
ncbi:MAG: site-specific integrase [Desulfobacterales bacterium]|nr:site-specific integrase [Desulfobacterales bacterium]